MKKRSIKNTFMNEKFKKKYPNQWKRTFYPPSLSCSDLVLTPTTYKKPIASLVSMQFKWANISEDFRFRYDNLTCDPNLPSKISMLFLAGKFGFLKFFRSQRSDTAAVALPIHSRTFILSISGSSDFFQIGGEKKWTLLTFLHSFSDHTFQTKNCETGQEKINHRVWSR